MRELAVSTRPDLFPSRETSSVAGVWSEVGELRRVLVHRPGPELTRITPANKDTLLFDDVPWLNRAQEEHDGFADLLRSRGVEVLYLDDLLTDVLEIPQTRSRLIAAAVDQARLGESLAAAVTGWLHGLHSRPLARILVAGITISELPFADKASSLLAWTAADDEFAIGPLPNHMFTRDSSAWVGRLPFLGTMALDARRRESVHLGAIYETHAMFDGRGEPLITQSPVEGGDVLVLAPNRMLVGVGTRTSAPAVEHLASEILRRTPQAELLVASLPQQRRTMHLDTVITMLDRDAFSVYPPVTRSMPVFRLRAGRGGLRIDAEPDLASALRRFLGAGPIKYIETGGDVLTRDREQWDDANNVLAIRPGVLVNYDRNPATNERLTAAGFEVLTVAGSELGRGRGGARCLSCPLERAPLSKTG